MPAHLGTPTLPAAARRTLGFAIPAALVLAALYLACRLAPLMPPAVFALAWALLSSISACGLAYRFTARKAHRQLILAPGGRLARLNAGRTLSLVVAFVVSGFCMASFMLGAAGWGTTEWVIAALVVPTYLVAAILCDRLIGKEFDPPFFRIISTERAACWLTCALLCAVYLAICIFEPRTTYADLNEALLATGLPFEHSPSALLTEVGTMLAYGQALVAYGLAHAADSAPVVPLLAQTVLHVSALFGIANLASACHVGASELRRVFLPLDAQGPTTGEPLLRSRVALAGALTALLAAGFLVADALAARARQTEEYTAAQQFVRDQAGVAADVIDGTYYRRLAVEQLVDSIGLQADELQLAAQEELVPLINAACDQQIANVDDYLDWYYSVGADYERLVRTFTGTLESAIADQMAQRLGEGVDDSELTERLAYYTEQADELRDDLASALETAKIADVPDWLVVSDRVMSLESVYETLDPSSGLFSFETRTAVSAAVGAGTGAVAGVATAKIAKKMVAQPLFKKAASKLAGKLAQKAASTAIGAAAGTVVAPGVGTAIGIGVGIATDFASVKIDEALNREDYKAEIVATIEETRAELLAMVA